MKKFTLTIMAAAETDRSRSRLTRSGKEQVNAIAEALRQNHVPFEAIVSDWGAYALPSQTTGLALRDNFQKNAGIRPEHYPLADGSYYPVNPYQTVLSSLPKKDGRPVDGIVVLSPSPAKSVIEAFTGVKLPAMPESGDTYVLTGTIGNGKPPRLEVKKLLKAYEQPYIAY